MWIATADGDVEHSDEDAEEQRRRQRHQPPQLDPAAAAVAAIIIADASASAGLTAIRTACSPHRVKVACVRTCARYGRISPSGMWLDTEMEVEWKG